MSLWHFFTYFMLRSEMACFLAVEIWLREMVSMYNKKASDEKLLIQVECKYTTDVNGISGILP